MDLQLVSDKDLIHELRKRGIACVIGFVKQDESTGTGEALFGTFQNGPAKTCLGLAAVLLEKVQFDAFKAGLKVSDIRSVIDEAHKMVASQSHGTV